jgi:hypothetical protein
VSDRDNEPGSLSLVGRGDGESAKWIFEISVFCRLTKYEFEEMFHRAGFDHNCTVLVTASCQGGIR